MRGSRGPRSLLRRRLWALGAALTRNAAVYRELTRTSASLSATAGSFARAARGHGEAAIPASTARAPAVAAVIVLAAVCCVSPARGDSGTTPPAAPTSTTPDAPPPDPYQPPAKASPKPRQSRPAVVHSAPVYHPPVPTYMPPAPTVQVRTYQPSASPRPHPRPAKVVHKRKPRVVHRHAAPKPKPVRVTFNPFARLVAASNLLAVPEDTSDRSRYLWLAGFAFAILAAAGLSLHTLAVRAAE